MCALRDNPEPAWHALIDHPEYYMAVLNDALKVVCVVGRWN